jgi:hypothetical protein
VRRAAESEKDECGGAHESEYKPMTPIRTTHTGSKGAGR